MSIIVKNTKMIQQATFEDIYTNKTFIAVETIKGWKQNDSSIIEIFESNINTGELKKISVFTRPIFGEIPFELAICDFIKKYNDEQNATTKTSE